MSNKIWTLIFQLIFRERYVSMAFMKKYIHVAKGIKVGIYMYAY